MVLLLKQTYIFLYICRVGCIIRNVTLLKTLAAPVYEVVESSSCVHSIPLVILHLVGIFKCSEKYIVLD
jgi:hypothetical protein